MEGLTADCVQIEYSAEAILRAQAHDAHLQFVDVGHGVHRPDVIALQREGNLRSLFRGGIRSIFDKAEGVHAEDVTVAERR